MTTQIVKYAGFEDFLTHMAEERAGAIALLHGANDRYNRVTWAGFSRDVHARADELRESGKTCLAILCDGSDTSVVELFAANIAGLQVAMRDTAEPDKMLAQLLPYVDADALWCANEKRAAELDAYLAGPAADGAGKILFFTSGTTSRSKAVTLTDSSLMASAYGGSGTFPLDAGDVLLCVLPPLVTCPAWIFPIKALPMATGLMPGCHRKYRSSNWMRAVANFSGTVSRGGNRHCPSVAIRAPSKLPSRSSTTVEYGTSRKSVRGRQQSQASSTSAAETARMRFRDGFFIGSRRRCRKRYWRLPGCYTWLRR